jgi:hypothetical protein
MSLTAVGLFLLSGVNHAGMSLNVYQSADLPTS